MKNKKGFELGWNIITMMIIALLLLLVLIIIGVKSKSGFEDIFSKLAELFT